MNVYSILRVCAHFDIQRQSDIWTCVDTKQSLRNKTARELYLNTHIHLAITTP